MVERGKAPPKPGMPNPGRGGDRILEEELATGNNRNQGKYLGTKLRALHTNHSIFWKNLSPNGGGEPTGELAEAIDRDFGSFEKFKAHFSAAALGLQGSGWAVLGYDHIAGRLLVEQLTDQQGNTSVNFTPLLMLDMWEHAFYLQYKNVKPDYVKAVWNVLNWDDVAERFAAAKK